MGLSDVSVYGTVIERHLAFKSEQVILNRLLSVVRSRTDKIIELSRAALTVPRYGESNRLVGVD